MHMTRRSWEEIPFRVTTPMFIGRGGPDRSATFRLASLRGALRFWLRFLAEPYHAELADLQAFESGIFGNTEHSSPTCLKPVEWPAARTDLRPSWLPEKPARRNRVDIRYLLGQGLYDNKDKALTRSCLEPGDEGRFALSWSGVNATHDRTFVLTALWFLMTFGGLGARTSRGFGGIQFDLPADFLHTLDAEQEQHDIATDVEKRGAAADVFDGAMRSRGAEPRADLPETPRFPSSRAYSVYYLDDTGHAGPDGWKSVLDDCAEWLLERRRPLVRRDGSRTTDEYETIAWPLWRGDLVGAPPFDVGVFGLPVTIRSRSRQTRPATVTPILRGSPLRRPSTAILKAVRGQHHWYQVLILDQSEFLPQEAHLEIRSGRDKARLAMPTNPAERVLRR